MHITFASFKDAVLVIGSLVSAITVITGAALYFAKPIRKKAVKWVKTIAQTDELDKTVRSIRKTQEEFQLLVTEYREPLEHLKGAQLCLLRNEITKVYFFYLGPQRIPAYEKQNVIRMNEAYIRLGGNSYVAHIVSEMLAWPVISESRAGT